ncbi:hypothetical protein PYCC9005_001959 [Savitreella phatthalungensis]
MSAPPTERRLARGQHREELDASVLKLGEVFGHVDAAMTMSEAALIVNAIRERRGQSTMGSRPGEMGVVGGGSGDGLNNKQQQQQQRGNEPPTTEAMRKTLEYLDVFVKFRTEAATRHVESLLSRAQGLHPFERAQLGTLCPEEAEEAKTLIPSLGPKVDDDDLQILLDEVNEMRRFA